jgi:hypothetical protein
VSPEIRPYVKVSDSASGVTVSMRTSACPRPTMFAWLTTPMNTDAIATTP